jgi:hypothetical protein
MEILLMERIKKLYDQVESSLVFSCKVGIMEKPRKAKGTDVSKYLELVIVL